LLVAGVALVEPSRPDAQINDPAVDLDQDRHPAVGKALAIPDLTGGAVATLAQRGGGPGGGRDGAGGRRVKHRPTTTARRQAV